MKPELGKLNIMALTKTAPAPTTTGPVSDATVIGGFEDMEGTSDPKTAANEPDTAAAAAAPAPAAAPPAAAPAPAPTTAVQVAPTRPVVPTADRAEAKKFADEVAAMKGAADFAYGNYQEFKGINGEIKCKTDNINFGRWVKGSMIAWDNHFEVSPNSKNDKSRDSVAYSKDGVTIDHVIGKEYKHWAGKSVQDYLKELRTEMEYPEADSREFIDVAFVIHEADKSSVNEQMAGEIVKIVLSKSSIPSFSQYQEKLTQKARAVARGIPGVKVPEDPFTFYFVRENVSANGNDWTKLAVHDKLPAL